jgi:hypothetical protein
MDTPALTPLPASDPPDPPTARQLASCLEAVAHARPIVEVPSRIVDSFGPEIVEIESDVTVMLSGRLAARYLRAVASTRGRRCVTQDVLAVLTAPSQRVGPGKLISVAAIAAPARTPAISFGYRVTVVARDVAGLPVWTLDDLFGFQSGPAVIFLHAYDVRGQRVPYSTTAERRLLALLAARATGQR